MTTQNARQHEPALRQKLSWIVLFGGGFSLVFGFVTGEWLISIVTCFSISGTIFAIRCLDYVLLQPWLKRLPRDRQLILQLTFSLLEHILGAMLAYFVCSLVFGFSGGSDAVRDWTVLVTSMFTVSMIFNSTRFTWRFHSELKEKELAEEELRALATQAELKALKAQINPHFLFNTLNAIAELIHTDPAQAEATVERLAEMFRYVLMGSERGLAPLKEELSFVDSYLEIEKARFGERLHVTREIDQQVLNASVPSLLLQPLVENTVQHGKSDDGSINLTIHVQPFGNEVIIAITDRGPGMPPHYKTGTGRGVGLRNVDERLRKTYGDGYGLEIAANAPQGTVITIKIPAGSEI